MSKGAFAKISGASATGGGNNIRDGIYKFLVEKVSIQNGHTGECFIAEFRVIDSSPTGARDEQGRPVVPNAPGSTCSMVANLTKHESAAGNAKAFVANALAGLGYTEDQITPELMAEICSEGNPMRGVAVQDETYRGVNKGRANAANAGKPLTLNRWRPITQTKEDVVAQKAWLDKNPPKVDAAAQVPAAAVQPAMQQQTVQPTTQPASTPTKSGGALAGILGK